MPNDVLIRIHNHETGEDFSIVSIEKFIEWLNDVDDIFTFKLEEDYA